MMPTRGNAAPSVVMPKPAVPTPVIPKHLPMPLPQQFGLPGEFDADEYLAKIEQRKKLHERMIFIAAYSIAFSIILWVIIPQEKWTDFPPELTSGALYTFLLLPAFWACLGSMPINYWFKLAYARYVGDLVSPSVRPYYDARMAWVAAVLDWNERQTETGRTYWKGMRGVAFEEAVKALLTKRGCKVQTTKGSGDGGVDLVVMFGSSTFWCQCKGHASPVGVAVVREIAGVCSRGGGVPVVIAVNGYTKAATETAQQLGVLLIDTHNLVKIAGQQRISQWN